MFVSWLSFFFKKKGVPCPEQTIQAPSYLSMFLKLSLAVWNCYTLGESISNRTFTSYTEPVWIRPT